MESYNDMNTRDGFPRPWYILYVEFHLRTMTGTRSFMIKGELTTQNTVEPPAL